MTDLSTSHTSFSEVALEQRIAEYHIRVDEHRRAELAAMPTTTGALLIKKCSPIRKYYANWFVVQTDGCPHCGRSHCTVITGTTRPRHAKLERARAGEHVGRCPYAGGWPVYRVATVRDEVQS